MKYSTLGYSIALLFGATAHADEPKDARPRDAEQLPGQVGDGSILLPNQWRLRPAGKSITVGDFPVNIAMHPSGDFAVVLHSGYGQHELAAVDLKTGALVSRVALPETFYGLTFSSDGGRIFCSGAGTEMVHSFAFAAGYFSDRKSIALRDEKLRGVPAGMTIAPDGTLYIANLWGHSVTRVRTDADSTETIEHLPLIAGSDAAAPEKPKTTDDESITKRANQLLENTDDNLPFPYTCVYDAKRERLYVSLWAQRSVAVIDANEWKILTRWSVEEHPNEMLLHGDGERLFVANANRNSVSVLNVETGTLGETLVSTLTPDAPPGNTPNSLAVSPDGERLFVANANTNTVGVFEIETAGKSRSLGFIPVGWYPTSVRVAKDGKTLLVANGKGFISKPNRHYGQPGENVVPTTSDYIGAILNGTLSVIALPEDEGKFEETVRNWTGIALQNMPPTEMRISALDLTGNPVPRKIGDASPIRHIIYMIKENRTYDQVLGDVPGGNGDPSLAIFGESITPNHHALAKEFVLLDNFYVESEVSADGHEWSMGAYATDFVEKNWPLSYRGGSKFPYPSEGAFEVAAPAGGYLWDRAAEANVSFRSYGEWVRNVKEGGKFVRGEAKVKALEGKIDPLFPTFDMDITDVSRAERFIAELKRFEAEGAMPQLQVVRLPNDHTSGASPGKPTPIAHVADNDLAFGMVVEAVSQSKFWESTAIFVVEDDAQNGPDHVDAHRTIAYVISPWTKRASKDSTLYSTASMLRTIELILGLQPMSQFDAAAMPMFACFGTKPDARPYQLRPVTVDRDAKNLRTAWGAEESIKINLAVEDAADDILLNEIIWRSIRGATAKMPAPVRAGFVISNEQDES